MDIYFNKIIFSNHHTGEGDVWNDTPTVSGTIIYSILVPFISFIALMGNGVSICVLLRDELVGSVYTYLTVLAGSNACSALCLFLGGLSRGAMWWNGWETYDALLGLPMGGFFNCVSVVAIVWVTIDRVVFLWEPCQINRPKMCTPRVARNIIMISIFGCLLSNLPYCFIYDLNSKGKLILKDWFTSTSYRIHNWCYITIFAIIPSIILIFGNGFLISHIKKAAKLGRQLKKFRKRERQISMTLVAIIICFFVTEIPAILLSRTTASNLLFNGDNAKTESKEMEITRQIFTLISAFNLVINFITYYLFCPQFYKAFKNMVAEYRCCCRRRRRSSSLHVNVFVINNNNNNEKIMNPEIDGINKFIVAEKIAELAKKKFEFQREKMKSLQFHKGNRIVEDTDDLCKDGDFV